MAFKPVRGVAALLLAFVLAAPANAEEPVFDPPSVLLDGVGVEISASGFYDDAALELRINDTVIESTTGRSISASDVTVTGTDQAVISVYRDGVKALEKTVPVIPG